MLRIQLLASFALLFFASCQRALGGYIAPLDKEPTKEFLRNPCGTEVSKLEGCSIPLRELLSTKISPATAPSPVASAPKVAPDGYDASLLPWAEKWSDSDIATQRAAGSELLQNISTALASGKSSYTITAGTYRLGSQITIEDTSNFTLVAKAVQLITEEETLHFFLHNNTNITIQGPLTLDANPFGFTQGSIIYTDNTTVLSIKLMEGYGVPNSGGRIMFFDRQGGMLPMDQFPIQSVNPRQGEPDVYDIALPNYFWTTYAAAREQAIAIGHYVSIEQGKLTGGINMGGNEGVLLSNITVHSASLTFGRDERGPVVIRNLRGVRRPGTNRLGAGGFVAISIQGGSFLMTDSELSYNFDDLTDIQSGMSYAFGQISSRQMYIGFGSDMEAIGMPLQFYNLETLAFEGAANVSAIEEVADEGVISSFQNGLTNLGLLNWNITPVLVTLSAPIIMSGNYSLVDDMQARASSIIFDNCFMHDSLASGINAKGAASIVIRNNTVVRTGYRGASAGYDPYWWEGGVPANIIIEDNIIDSVPYTISQAGQAISTYVDTSADLLAKATASPIHNVTVRNNTIVNPPVAAIGLSFASNIAIADNTIIRPVSAVANRRIANAEPFAEAAAIFLDAVAGSAEIVRNRVLDVNPQVVSQVPTPNCHPSSLTPE